MPGHIIEVDGLGLSAGHISAIKKAAAIALDFEQDMPACLVAVMLVTDADIRAINRDIRGTDRVTDVLSFPALELCPGQPPAPSPQDCDPETGAVFLGDIVISCEAARRQAADYGHSVTREAAFLAVHSVLHLLGHDHELGEAEERAMFELQDKILEKAGIGRDLEDEPDEGR